MLKFNKDQLRLPVGGHHYVEYGKTFKGEDVPDLEKQIAAFRLANNIPAGNPKQEILNFYAKNWPYMVKRDYEGVETVSDEDYIHWRQWIYDTWSRPPKKLLTTKEAKERWEICLKCPLMRRFKWESTDESAELTRRAFILRRGIEIPHEIGYCSLHRTDVGVYVFIDQSKSFSAMKDAEQPKECWVS